jgi:hypothetical protein
VGESVEYQVGAHPHQKGGDRPPGQDLADDHPRQHMVGDEHRLTLSELSTLSVSGEIAFPRMISRYVGIASLWVIPRLKDQLKYSF